MGLLDIFRPKWKHSRAEVRLEAVRAMSDDDLAVLREVARLDPEIKIREAAMKRLPDAALLSELATEDRDEGLRDLAAKRASELSLRTAIDATSAEDGLAAVKRISDPKVLVDVVRRAGLHAVKAEALARIEDQRALLDVVVKGEPLLKQGALARIKEPRVLRDVALSEATTKALQLTAIATLADQPALKAIVERSKSKAIRAAAKERMTALGFKDEAAQPKAKKEKKAADPQAEVRLKQRKVETEMRRRAEEERKAQVGRRKAELEAEHAARLARIESGQGIEEDEHLSELERAEAAEYAKKKSDRQAKQKAEQLASETPEQKAAREAREADKAAREEVRRVRDAERAAQAHENVAQLESLTARLESLATSDDLKEAGATMKEALSSQAARGSLPDGHEALRKRFEDARTKLATKLSAAREAEDWKRFAAVPKLEALITRAEDLAKLVIGAVKLEEGAELDAQKVMRELKAMQAQWKEIGRPPRDKADMLWERFKAATDIIYEGNKKNLDMVDEERAENLKMKEELCARVEALVESAEAQGNPKTVSEQLKVMQEDWKKIGPVPRTENDKVWTRFRTACDKFFVGRKQEFAKQDEVRGQVLEQQQTLVRKAESLAGSQDWKGTADKLKALQDEWKQLGHGKKGESDEAWQKFRAACDRFFEARQAHFAEQDGEREANFAKKEELVARVEQLAKDESVEDVDAKIRELMGEWKKIGPVAKDKGDEVWARFGKALDALRAPSSEPVAEVIEQANVGWKAPTLADKLKPREPKKPAAVQAKATTPSTPSPVKEPTTPHETPPSPVQEPVTPPPPAQPSEPPVEEPPAPPATIPATEPVGDPAPKQPAPVVTPQEIPDPQALPPAPEDVPSPAPATTQTPTTAEASAEAPAQEAWPAPEDWSLPDDHK